MPLRSIHVAILEWSTMSGLSRFRGCPILFLGLTLLFLPISLQAQSAQERAREEQLRRVEEGLKAVQEKRRVLIEEALARARQELAEVEERELEVNAVRIEEALARARDELAEVKEREAEMNALRIEALEESLQEARERGELIRDQVREQREQFRDQVRERREQYRDQARELRQVVVRMRNRVRLGVSLDGGQGEEYDRQGALIQGIIENSPAEDVGLQMGDIITHLNGHHLLDPLPEEDEEELDQEESLPVQRLMALARELDPGEEAEIRFLRDGEPQNVTVEAADMEEPGIAIYSGDLGKGLFRFEPGERGTWRFSIPEEGAFEFEMPDLESLEDLDVELKDFYVGTPNLRYRAWPEGAVEGLTIREGRSPFVYGFFSGMGRFGLQLTELNPGLAEYFSVGEGVLVLDVEEESPLGLVPGDVILSIGGREVQEPEDVRRILGSYDEDETIAFRVVRKGGEMGIEGRIR